MSLPSNFRIAQKSVGGGDNTSSYNTTSLVLVCQPHQAKHVQALLQKIENHTTRPDEIILVINNAQRVVQQLRTNDRVKIIRSQSNLSDHDLFNIGIDTCISDIIIFHRLGVELSDQKVDIIKYFFSKFKVTALSHLSGCQSYNDYSQIKYLLQRDDNSSWLTSPFIGQNPLPAVTRLAALKLKMSSEGDYLRELSDSFSNSIFVEAKLGF